MILQSQPPEWSSAHRPIEYVFTPFRNLTTSITNSGGSAELNFGGSSVIKAVVGDKVYIESGDYLGEHDITVVTSQSQFTIDTDYIANDTVWVRMLVTPTVRVYKGYLSFEAFPSDLPFTLVATFRPEVDVDYDISFDISGYVKNIFRIIPPTEGRDFNMFNQYRLTYQYTSAEVNNQSYANEVYVDPRLALNAAIKTNDLNSYVNSNLYLGSNMLFGCGKTILTRLTNLYAENVVLEESPGLTDFNSDFNSDFLL